MFEMEIPINGPHVEFKKCRDRFSGLKLNQCGIYEKDSFATETHLSLSHIHLSVTVQVLQSLK
jgi:hypothetical protein